MLVEGCSGDGFSLMRLLVLFFIDLGQCLIWVNISFPNQFYGLFQIPIEELVLFLCVILKLLLLDYFTRNALATAYVRLWLIFIFYFFKIQKYDQRESYKNMSYILPNQLSPRCPLLIPICLVN